MYYGGDIAELMVAFALVSRWRPRRAAAAVAVVVAVRDVDRPPAGPPRQLPDLHTVLAEAEQAEHAEVQLFAMVSLTLTAAEIGDLGGRVTRSSPEPTN